jgi:MYXO-CTERM domain-containing protein
MASNATKAGALALGLALVAGLGGCGNDPTGGQTDPQAGGMIGELSVVSVLGSTDHSSLLYFLRPSDGSKSLPLLFDAEPALTSGTTLRVWGTTDATGLRVSRYEALPPPSGAVSIAAATPLSQTVAWVQIDVNGGGVSQTAAQASALIFDQNAGPIFGTKTGNLSVVQYYAQASFGLLQLSGDVVGPVPFSGTACNNLDGVAQAVVPEVTALGKSYNHYYLYWGAEQNCGPGWGSEGTHNKPQADVWLNMDGTFCTATGQELGHNFGLMHASTMDCGTATLANDTSTCTSSEYGNPMTVMGGGCRDFAAIEKWYSQWFQGCNGARINQSGTYTLFPLETACGGIQALQIPFPSGAPVRTTTTDQSNGNVTVNDYYLELRSSVGVDTGLKSGVYVYVAPEIPAATKTGPRTFLLDMNPSTSAFDPMTAGQTFTDPAGGVSFTVNSFDATKASVTVTITGGSSSANTCMDGTALSGSGPDSCAASSTGGTGGGSGGTGAGGASGGTTGTGAAGAGGRGGSTGTGGANGGRSGTGGSTGTGGTIVTGTGGAKGGTTGTGGGSGGATGSGGTGSGGASGGTTGSGGTSGGTTGTGGTIVTGAGGAKGGTTGSGGGNETGGASGTGSGGANGSGGATGGTTGSGGSGQETGAASGGCSCDVGGAGKSPWSQSSGLALLIGLGAVVARPRRAARARTKRRAPVE